MVNEGSKLHRELFLHTVLLLENKIRRFFLDLAWLLGGTGCYIGISLEQENSSHMLHINSEKGAIAAMTSEERASPRPRFGLNETVLCVRMGTIKQGLSTWAQERLLTVNLTIETLFRPS